MRWGAFKVVAVFFLFLGNPGNSLSSENLYAPCSGAPVPPGTLLYLRELEDGNNSRSRMCWHEIKNHQTINVSDFAVRGDRFSFVYVFGGTGLGEDFDPVFNVKAKTLLHAADRREHAQMSGNVHLFRSAMDTFCDKRSLNVFRVKRHFSEVSTSISGAVFNDYHRGKAGVPSSALSRFHIYFRDSQGVCRRTDDRQLRSLFAIEDVDFEDKPLLAKIFGRLLGVSTAIAHQRGADGYSDVLVMISRGSFKQSYFVSSFNLESGHGYKIIVKDLSTYFRELGGTGRKSVSFRVVVDE